MTFGPNPPQLQAHICVKGGLDAIAFYEKAFGAKCQFHKLADDGRRVMHANIELFGGEIMLHDEFPEFGNDVLSPLSRGGASIAINVNLNAPTDVDSLIERAHLVGAKIIMMPQDAFWGSRYGRIRDPFGHIWAFNAPLTKTAA